MSEPTITVCMPAYNAAPYLDAAIAAIEGQTYRDFELIILDDQSTDATPAIAQRHADSDRRIRVETREHQGYARLLNEGLRLARGDFFARMDADDLTSPDRFEKQLEYFADHPDCVAVGTWALIVDPQGAPIQRVRFPVSHAEIDGGNMSGRYQMVHASLMMRTAVLRRHGGYRVEFEPAEDFDLLLRLGEVGGLANLPAYMYMYRAHPRQVTVQRYETQQAAMAEALSQAGQRRRLPVRGETAFVHRRPNSAWQIHVVWARLALQHGFRQTARKHAVRGVILRPWSRTAWRTLWSVVWEASGDRAL
jgi:glycosyltransferase involved in cell wall biosynthesis